MPPFFLGTHLPVFQSSGAQRNSPGIVCSEKAGLLFFGERISQNLIIVFHKIQVLIPVPVLLSDMELHTSIICPV